MRRLYQRVGVVICSTLALGLVTPGSVLAQQPLTSGVWTSFEWFLGVGPVEGSGFSFQSAGPARLRVTDAATSGDAFAITINGFPSSFFTPSLPGGIDTGAFSGEDAWLDGRLSKTEILLDAGRYTVTLSVRDAASGFDYGEGFIRADFATVPEPSTVGLLASGLAWLGYFARRRRSRHDR